MKQGQRHAVRVSAGGRIVVPASVRRRLGLDAGTDVILTVENDHAVLMSAKAARRRAQELVRRCIPPGVSLSEELMAERKQDALRE